VTSPSATHVVLLTPTGRGAVASLTVEGPAAVPLVDELFHPAGGRAFREQPVGRIVVGRWLSPDAGEEVVVACRGAERVEIHCHGGVAAARAIIDSLEARGCRQLDWRIWTRRHIDDPIAAAAEIALAAAPTARTASILWDQRSGALRRAIDEIASLVANRDRASALARVEDVLRWSSLGLHLVAPWKVVLAGRPNVGKSSLINALVGYQRAIVHPTPGTTRDIVTAATAIDGWPVELADTAGLHASHEALEVAGIELARKQLAAADLVVLVFDASMPLCSEDQQLKRQWPAAIQVYNKCDLLGTPSPKDGAKNHADGRLYTSALAGTGIDDLAALIGHRLVPQAPPPGQAMPFVDRHVRALERIGRDLDEGRLEAAAALLASHESWDEAC
jgi:tRNA modification GTPase